MKQRSIGILLAIFLGGLGIHKFYTNRPGWGIVYLIFCWTLVPAVLGLVEGIYWLTKTDEQFESDVMGSSEQRSAGHSGGDDRQGVPRVAVLGAIGLVLLVLYLIGSTM